MPHMGYYALLCTHMYQYVLYAMYVPIWVGTVWYVPYVPNVRFALYARLSGPDSYRTVT